MEREPKNGKTVQWREAPGSRLIVEQRGGVGLRLFGLLFLGMGVYLLYQFVDGLLHGDLTIIGAVVLPVLALAFFAPGVILTFGRKRSVLDAARREISEVRDYGVLKRQTSTILPNDTQVLVRYELRRTGGGSTHLYCPVELTLDAARRVTLAEFDGREGDQALALAGAAAALLGAPLLDQRDQGPGVIVGADSDDDEDAAG